MAGSLPASAWAQLTARVPLDAADRVTILFDLNGCLIQTKMRSAAGAGYAGMHAFAARPGLHHLVSLLSHFRLGIFTSAAVKTVAARVQEIEALLWSDPGLAVRWRMPYRQHASLPATLRFLLNVG